MPLVSMIIPAHNCAQYIHAAVTSALRQTHSEVEVVVVDDGSTDDTGPVARAFGEPVRVFHQANAGPSAARNLGLANAHGEYVAFLDADDEVDPRWMSSLLQALQGASPRARFAVSDAWLWNGTRFIDRYRVSNPPGGERDLTAFLDDNRPYVAILARREDLRAAGGFRAALWLNEDFHLWLRLLRSGQTYVYVPEPLYRYRVRDESLSSDCRRRLQDACALYREVLEGLPLTPGQRRRVAYLLWRERARVSHMDAVSARVSGRLGRWAARECQSAAAQAVRVLLRPHFSIRRVWRNYQEARRDTGKSGFPG